MSVTSTTWNTFAYLFAHRDINLQIVVSVYILSCFAHRNTALIDKSSLGAPACHIRAALIFRKRSCGPFTFDPLRVQPVNGVFTISRIRFPVINRVGSARLLSNPDRPESGKETDKNAPRGSPRRKKAKRRGRLDNALSGYSRHRARRT